MVKCWDICFSLCCALCSPPQRTRGGSNTAATTKKEPTCHEIKIKPRVHSEVSLLPFARALGLQGKYLCTPHKLMLTLNSSLKSLPSSAERIRYSSSSESRGIGKYLLDGEGDLGRRTTVCSPVFRGIYGGQTANTSQKRTLEVLRAPAKTGMKAIKMSPFCGHMTGMIS